MVRAQLLAVKVGVKASDRWCDTSSDSSKLIIGVLTYYHIHMNKCVKINLTLCGGKKGGFRKRNILS